MLPSGSSYRSGTPKLCSLEVGCVLHPCWTSVKLEVEVLGQLFGEATLLGALWLPANQFPAEALKLPLPVRRFLHLEARVLVALR